MPERENPPTMVVFDPLGEIASITLHHESRAGVRGYIIDPYGIHILPAQRFNPLESIDLEEDDQ